MKVPIQTFNFTIKPRNGFVNNAVDIYIDGYIVDADTQEFFKEYFGDSTSVSYRSFRNEINNVDAEIYNIYINSGGGLVTDAMAMHDFIVELQNKKGKTVNTYVVGLAASAATFIAMASNNPAMSANSKFMIHNVSGAAYGNVDEVESQARTLREFNDHAVQFYADRTGLTRTVITNMMKAETWMDAPTAKDKGFIKTVTAETKFTNAIKKEHWPYTNMAVLNAYNADVAKPEDAEHSNIQITNDMKKFFQDLKNEIINGIKGVQPTMSADNKLDIEAYNTGVATAIASAFENVSEGFEQQANEVVNTQFNTLVSNLATNEAFNNAVSTAVTNATKGDAFTTAVNTAVNTSVTALNLATKEDLKPVQQTVEKVDKDLDKLDIQNKGGSTNTNGTTTNSTKPRGIWTGSNK